MNYRIATIKSYTDISTAATKSIPVNFNDICSRLSFDYRYKTPDVIAATYLEHPVAMVDKIEIVDGSNIIGSLTGKELAAQMFYDDKKPFTHVYTIEKNGYGHFILNWDFGRYLWDNELAFDPGKFDNPEIKVTYDMANLHADMQYLWQTVYAHLYDEKVVSPTGFIMRKQIKEWTPTADAHEPTVLPTDYPYRQAYIYAYRSERSILEGATEFKLSEDEDKRIPIDIDMKEWIYLQFGGRYPKIYEDLIAKETATEQFVCVAPSFDLHGTAGQGDAEVAEIEKISNNSLSVLCSGAAHGRFYRLSGYVMLHSMPILMHDMQDIADWYDVTRIGSLKLDTLADGNATTSTKAAVHLEQYRPY